MTRDEVEKMCAQVADKNGLEFMSKDHYPLIESEAFNVFRCGKGEDPRLERSHEADGFELQLGVESGDGDYFQSTIVLTEPHAVHWEHLVQRWLEVCVSSLHRRDEHVQDQRRRES